MITLSWLDYLIIGIIGLSIITGLFRGFIKELTALCIWVLAIWLAFTYTSTLDPWLQPYIDEATARKIVAFIAILLATIIVGAILNTLLSLILHRSGLSAMDRLFGMCFGLVRGVFIVSLIILIVKMTSLAEQEFIHQSQLYPKFDPVVNWLQGYTPEMIKKVKEFDPSEHEMDIDTTDVNPEQAPLMPKTPHLPQTHHKKM